MTHYQTLGTEDATLKKIKETSYFGITIPPDKNPDDLCLQNKL